MASIEIDISKVISGLSNIESNLKDMSSLFKNIGDLELSQTMLRFRKEVDPDGKPWPDPITIRRDGGAGRQGGFTQEQSWNYVLKSNFHAAPPGWHFFSRARGDKVMTDTGTLRRSIGRDYGPDYVVIGTNVEYSKKLQNGRFPFLGINKKTDDNVKKAVAAFMKGITK